MKIIAWSLYLFQTFQITFAENNLYIKYLLIKKYVLTPKLYIVEG